MQVDDHQVYSYKTQEKAANCTKIQRHKLRRRNKMTLSVTQISSFSSNIPVLTASSLLM